MTPWEAPEAGFSQRKQSHGALRKGRQEGRGPSQHLDHTALDIFLLSGEAQQKHHFLFTLKETEAPEVTGRPAAEAGLEPGPQPPVEAGEA